MGLFLLKLEVMHKCCLMTSFVETYYDRVKDYFSFDPMLLNLFAYLAPKENFVALCNRVPPYLSTEILVKRALLPIHPEVNIGYVLAAILK